MPETAADTRVLAERLRAARRVTVLTGAGVSVASGVPTFRGHGGLWRQYRAVDLATPEAFAHDPDTVWEWYQWRRSLIAACRPNAAHEVLARWSMRDHWQVVTQNVDDLHLRAGTRNLIRLHGSIWELSCDVFIAAGTSAVVHPAAGLIAAARRAGAYTVEINPEPTEASPCVNQSFQAGAEALLPQLDALL